MSEPTFRELARRRGVVPMAKNLRKQGASINSALRMLLGINPIPVLTDAVRVEAHIATRQPARLLTL